MTARSMANSFSRAVLTIAICVTSPLRAESEEGVEVSDLYGVLDLSMPTSPAFTILGLTPETVSNPQTGSDLAASLLDGLDARGNAQNGVALDFRPYMIAAGDNTTLWNYQQDPLRRQLARISLSLATASGQSEADEADRYAIGLKWVPIDEADPRTDLAISTCFKSVLDLSDGEVAPSPDGNPVVVEDNDELSSRAAECRKEFTDRTWNGRSLQFGIATFRVDTEGDKKNGTGVWSAYSHPIGTRGQVVVHARELHDELVPPQEGESGFQLRDSRSFGVRARYGTGSAYFMVESMRTQNNWASEREDDSFVQHAVGAEFRLAKGVWLQLSYGKSSGRGAPEDDAVFASQLRFGFTRERLTQLGL